MSPDEITTADVNLWRLSLMARRMPGLKAMPDSEVRLIMASDMKGVLARRSSALPQKTWPKTNFKKGQKAEIEDDGVFIPCSSSKAKAEAARPDDERFAVNLGTPYGLEHAQFVADQTLDISKRCSSGDWKPTGGSSKVKDAIRNKANLNISSHIYSI